MSVLSDGTEGSPLANRAASSVAVRKEITEKFRRNHYAIKFCVAFFSNDCQNFNKINK